MKKTKKKMINNYDNFDTTGFIDKNKPLKFEDIGYQLPENPPTQVVSIRVPSILLNQIKAIASKDDVPYQALIKLMLSEAVSKRKKAA